MSLAVATSTRLGNNWRARLPGDVLEALEDTKKSWRDGTFRSSGQALARSIKQKLIDRGHETVGVGEIYKWLAQR